MSTKKTSSKTASKKAPSYNTTNAVNAILNEIELFHDKYEDAFAAVKSPATNHCFPVGSSEMRRVATLIVDRVFSRTLTRKMFDEISMTLEAKAVFYSPEMPVYYRYAHYNGAVYIDCARKDGSVLKLSGDGGIEILASGSPVKFRKKNTNLPLPVLPDEAGDAMLLKEHINYGTDDNWKLILAYIVLTMIAEGPYTILVIQGEHGCGKSLMSKNIVTLVDPKRADLRTKPRTEDDFVISLFQSHLAAFDNLSGLKDELSDSLCKVATGFSSSKKKLYTDMDEVVIDLVRPVIINGIDTMTARSDLADRAAIIDVPVIPSTERRDPATMAKKFDADAPVIFKGLCELVCKVLAIRDTIVLPSSPRMVNFAKVGTALEVILRWKPGSFLQAYASNRYQSSRVAVEGSHILSGLVRVLLECEDYTFEGTTSDLLQQINLFVESEDRGEYWPRSAAGLGKTLNRLAADMRNVGMEFEKNPRTADQRKITVSLGSYRPNAGNDGNDDNFENLPNFGFGDETDKE